MEVREAYPVCVIESAYSPEARSEGGVQLYEASLGALAFWESVRR